MKNSKKREQEVQDELHSLSPLLSKMKSADSGMKVPTDYFSNLEKDLSEQLGLDSPSVSVWKSFSNWLQPLWQPRLAYALAGLTILLAAVFWMTQNPTTSPIASGMNELSDDEIFQYLDAHIDDLELDLLVNVVADNPEDTPLDLGTELFEDEDLDEYLDELLDEMSLEELEELL